MPVYVYEAKEKTRGCPRCSEGFEITQSIKDDRLDRCPDCGAELIEGGAFCGECGAKIPESALSRVIIAPAYPEGKKPQAMPKESPKSTDNVKKGGTRVKRRIKRTRKNKKGTDGCS